jgi:plasmid stability protein
MTPKRRNQIVAVLNVKSVPDKLYRKLQARAKRERRSVAQEVLEILDQALNEPPRLSIMNLQGLGKDIWRDVDSDQYIEAERRAWD